MKFQKLIKRAQQVLNENSPALLTAVGVTGTVATAVLTGKASFKAAEILMIDDRDRAIFEKANPNTINPRTLVDASKLTWKLYIPAVSAGVLTSICIIGANRVGTRRTAAMAAAYSLSEKAFDEYKEKVVEKIGENKERDVRDSIAQDRVTNDSVGKNEVVVTGGGEVLCYDMFTGRYFNSSMETLKKAQNDINAELIHNCYASLTDFYSYIGLSSTTISDNLGWNSDNMLELQFSTTMSDDNRPCIAINFDVDPIRNFYRTH